MWKTYLWKILLWKCVRKLEFSLTLALILKNPHDRKSSIARRNKSWTRAQNVGPRLAVLFTSV